MELFILLIVWFATGLVYFINLCASGVHKNLSDEGIVVICIIFLPTTIILLIACAIKELYDYIVRLKNGKRKM